MPQAQVLHPPAARLLHLKDKQLEARVKLHRFGSFLAIALALALANVPIAQARHHYGRSPNAAQTRPDAGAETYAYVFHDAEITQVIDEVLGRGLKLTYRLDPGVTGKMSFSIEQRLTKAQLLAALEAALTQYDVVMLKQGDTLILKPRATAQIGAGVSQGRGPSAKLGYQVRAIPVHFASASEVAKVDDENADDLADPEGDDGEVVTPQTKGGEADQEAQITQQAKGAPG